MSRRRPRVAVLYNAPTLPLDHPEFASESGVVGVARAVSEALKTRGFKAWPMAAKPPVIRVVRSLENRKPDVIFNLIEGFGGHSGGEPAITSLLELLALPYTGCPPIAQTICRRKGSAKALLRGAGLPTAAFLVVEAGADQIPGDFPLPAMVKPESEDASLGIDQGSVVISCDQLAERVRYLHHGHGPRVLVEAYLPGPEYNVGVVALPEPRALPVAEVLFHPTPGGWPILTHAAKWDVGSEADLASPVRCPAEIDDHLAQRLQILAEAAFRATGCRDYARVDFRIDARGEPMILEVNPNPDLDPQAGLARAMTAQGRAWGDVVADLARQAIARGVVHE